MRTFFLVFACVFLFYTYVSCQEDLEDGDKEEIKELKVEVLHKPEDCEDKTKNGDTVSMHYTGSLYSNGKVFDTSRKRGEPFQFTLGKGDVIKGWDEGLLDMCVAEKRKLIIPPHLGYGDQGAGKDIPGGATLVFEVELMDIEEAQQPTNVFKQIDSNSDNQLSTEEVREFLSKQMAGIPSMASAFGGMDILTQAVESFYKYEDKNGDGIITEEEFQSPPNEPEPEEMPDMPEEEIQADDIEDKIKEEL